MSTFLLLFYGFDVFVHDKWVFVKLREKTFKWGRLSDSENARAVE
jgi:hypothetical protein